MYWNKWPSRLRVKVGNEVIHRQLTRYRRQFEHFPLTNENIFQKINGQIYDEGEKAIISDVIIPTAGQGPLFLTWFNFNPRMDT